MPTKTHRYKITSRRINLQRDTLTIANVYILILKNETKKYEPKNPSTWGLTLTFATIQ